MHASRSQTIAGERPDVVPTIRVVGSLRAQDLQAYRVVRHLSQLGTHLAIQTPSWQSRVGRVQSMEEQKWPQANSWLCWIEGNRALSQRVLSRICTRSGQTHRAAVELGWPPTQLAARSQLSLGLAAKRCRIHVEEVGGNLVQNSDA